MEPLGRELHRELVDRSQLGEDLDDTRIELGPGVLFDLVDRIVHGQRWLIGTHGTPLDIPNVCQIRHIVKGRYNKDSWWTRVRKFVRKSQDG